MQKLMIPLQMKFFMVQVEAASLLGVILQSSPMSV
jgi:hypothetical protein